LTGAGVAARRVGAFSAVADARIFLALVDIRTAASVHQQHVSSTDSKKNILSGFSVETLKADLFEIFNLHAQEKLPGVFMQMSSHPPLLMPHSSTSEIWRCQRDVP